MKRNRLPGRLRDSALILVLSVIVGVLAACGSPADRAAQFMQRAKALQAAGDPVKARLELKNVLQIDPRNVEAWALLGQIELRQGAWEQALRSFNSALSYDPNDLPSLVSRAGIYLSAGMPSTAQKDLELAASLRPDDPGVMLQQARLASAQGDDARAAALVRKSLQADPANSDAMIFQALLRKEKDLDGAIRALEQGLPKANRPTDVQAALAMLYREAGRGPDELRMLKLLALTGDDAEAVNRYAAALIRYHRADEAERVLRERMQKAEGDARIEAALVLAELYERTLPTEEAVRRIGALAKAFDGNQALRLRLAVFMQKNGKRSDARAIYEEVIARPENERAEVRARTGMAKILLQEQQAEAAKKQLDAALEVSKQDTEALSLRAGIALREGRYDAAIDDLRVLARERPRDPTVAEQLARAYLAKGNENLAIDQLSRFIEASPHEQRGYAALNELYVRLGRDAEAQQVLQKMLEALPNNPVALTRLAYYASKKGDLEAAVGYARQLRDSHPQGAENHYLLGQIYQEMGRHAEAIDTFSKAIELSPDWMAPITARVRSRIALHQEAVAMEELRALLKRNPKSFIAHNLLGELLRAEGRLDEALASFEKANREKKAWPVPYLNIADVKIRQGKYDEALAVLERAQKNIAASRIFTNEIERLKKRAMSLASNSAPH